MIAIKINCSRIEKARLFKGKNGLYLDLLLMEKPDDFGNAGFVCHSVSKEERANGVRGAIIGNWKHLGGGGAAKPKSEEPAPSSPLDNDDVPF